jgi:hypothetical protein
MAAVRQQTNQKTTNCRIRQRRKTMATKYFRITGYYPKEDISFIMDSNGMFEKLWQFSAFVVSKGCKVLEVSTDEKIIDLNIEKAEEDKTHVILRACGHGKPNYVEKTIGGITYKAVEIEGRIYIPNNVAI